MSSQPRVDYEPFRKIAPAVYAAMVALGKAVDDSGLDKALTELIKIRASQINGCAFCIQFHLNTARKAGVAAEKLDLVAAWHEAGVYTPREMAALAWTEALTKMATAEVTDALWVQLREHFSESEAVFLTASIGTINNWNRMAGTLRFTPQVPKTG
jgi:AhpD family alkylhydroperoxidase